MVSRDVKMCTPALQRKIIIFRNQCASAGIYFLIICTARYELDQIALYAQGRKTLDEVNDLRKVAGMPPISEAENKRPVTWTLDSKHVIGSKRPLSEAFDIVLTDHGKVHWDVSADVNANNIPDYIEAAKIAIGCGLRAGAFFSKKDYCHFEDVNHP